MSKLYDALQDQLKTEHKKEAEDCIKIYNVLKAISREKYGEEHVWSSDWCIVVQRAWLSTRLNNSPCQHTLTF